MLNIFEVVWIRQHWAFKINSRFLKSGGANELKIIKTSNHKGIYKWFWHNYYSYRWRISCCKKSVWLASKAISHGVAPQKLLRIDDRLKNQKIFLIKVIIID